MKIHFHITLLLLISACSFKPYIVEYSGHSPGSGENAVYIVSHGWHTGIVIPAEKILLLIPELKHRFNNAKFIEFGWGDKGFYQAEEITTGLIFSAIFWPSESVIHTVALASNVESYFSSSDIQRLCFSDQALRSLVSFISNSFYRDEQGKVVDLNRGIYGDSQFYKGVGDYHLMNTCNKWTAKGLKSAGMDISHTFKLTADSIMNYVADENQKRNQSASLAGFCTK